MTVARLLSFAIGDARCAASLSYFRGIERMSAPARMPFMPEWLLGAIAVRGDVLSVVDLRAFLGLRPASLSSAGDGSRQAGHTLFPSPAQNGATSRIGLPAVVARSASRTGHVLVTASGDVMLGLLVDRVDGLWTPEAGDIHPVPVPVPGRLGAYLCGMGRIGEHPVAILDVAALLQQAAALTNSTYWR